MRRIREHRQGWYVAAIAVALAAALMPATGATQDHERHVYVTVLDADGAPVGGLTADHFAIREGGRDRPVLRVEPLRTPMHVAVLVDSSIGNGMPVESFRAAIDGFIVRLAAFNHVAVYAFGNRASQVAPFSQDAAQLRAAMVGMFSSTAGGSYLIDAIDLAARDLKPLESPRPVVVAISSEAADASRKTAGAVIKQLIAGTVAFHAVSLASATGSGAASTINRDIPSSSQRLQGMIALGEGDRERTRALQQGTSVTGGSLQRVTSIAALGPALDRIARELAGSYDITFTRDGSDAMKDLQVGIMVDGVTLRATPALKR
jgi:VWFA-related protein